MKTLTGEQGVAMMNMIMAKTYLEDTYRTISKMKASEYMFSELHGQVKQFGNYQSVLNAKSKNAALSSIKVSLYTIDNEISILENQYEETVVELEEKEEKVKMTGEELLALFIGE